MRYAKIKEIMRKYKDVFEALEEYDKTHELPIGRIRIDITLDKKTVERLKKIREKTGKPISRIIEETLFSFLEKCGRQDSNLCRH